MKLYYLGPPKTFSEKAAKAVAEKLGQSAELEPLATLENVAQRLAKENVGSDSLAVMAAYNFLEGLVPECLDLLYENSLHIVGSKRIAIELSLGKAKNSRNVWVVYSHSKALAQCSDFLQANYCALNQNSVSSTAMAAKMVDEEGAGLAISSKEALLEAGLEIVAEDIGNKRDNRRNFTDFYVVAISPLDRIASLDHNRTLVAISPYSQWPDIFFDIFNLVHRFGLNVTKIHSRPALEQTALGSAVEPQMIYLEMMVSPESEKLKECLAELRTVFNAKDGKRNAVRLMGSYSTI